MQDPTQSDVVTMDDGRKYVRNQLLVSAKMDCTKEKRIVKGAWTRFGQAPFWWKESD